MSLLPGDVPDLGRMPRVIVTSRRIVFPADVTAFDGGLAQDNADVHLRIVDVIGGKVLYVPIAHVQAVNLQNMLDQLTSDRAQRS